MLSETKQYPLMYAAQSSTQVAEHYLPRLERLSKEGFDVHVLAADDGGFDALRRRGIFARPLPVGFSLNVAGWVGAYVIMQAYFLEQGPVLVHAFDPPMSFIAAFAARQSQVPAIFATVDHHVLGGLFAPPMAHAYGLLGQWVDKYLVTNAAEFATLSASRLIDEDKLLLVDPDDEDRLLSLYDAILSRHFTA
jgi:hypothetical protein